MSKAVTPSPGRTPQSDGHETAAISENWWEFCPICNSRLVNHKCRFVCSNPRCSFFMSCSEFDL